MASIKDQFSMELINNCLRAKQEANINCEQFIQSVQKYGGVDAVKASMSRNRASNNFDQLHKAGRVDLTPEATATKGVYQSLFDDDEMNFCIELLCECGYYGE